MHWYTADLHLGHSRVIELCKRPFANVGEMDATLIRNLWSCVGPEDDLWIVGDFAWGKKTDDESWLQGIFGQLPGARRHLVLGNHDLAGTQALPWDSVHKLAQLTDCSDHQPVTLCHYPMITFPRARDGGLHLFGHVHNSWKGSRNAVNVGVDVWDYRPVNIEDIRRRARRLPINRHWQDVEPGTKLR